MLDVVVDRAMFDHLRVVAPKAKRGLLSPLTGPADASRPVQARLGAAGLLDADGNATPAGSAAVGVLLRAASVVEIEVVGDRVFDHAVYFPGRGDPVSLTAMPDGLRLVQPAEVDAAVEVLREGVGNSAVAAVPFEAEVSAAESFALAALVDEERMHRLRFLGSGQAHDREGAHGLTAGEVFAAATSPSFGNVVVLTLIRSLRVPSLTPAQVETALAGLAGRGLAAAGSGRWRADGDAVALAGAFLVVEKIVTLRAATVLAEQETVGLLVAFACAGAHGVLAVEASADMVHLQSLSPRHMVTLADGLLHDVAVLRHGVEQPLVPA